MSTGPVASCGVLPVSDSPPTTPPPRARHTGGNTRDTRSTRDTPRRGRATIDDKLRESLVDTYQMLGLALITIAMPGEDQGLAATGVMVTESRGRSGGRMARCGRQESEGEKRTP
jgi:hypothetical protein